MVILLTISRKRERTFIASHLRAMGHDILEASDGEALEAISSDSGRVDMFISCEKNCDLLRQVEIMTAGGREMYTILTVPSEHLGGLFRDPKQEGIDDFLVSPASPKEFCKRFASGWSYTRRRAGLETRLNALRDTIKTQTKTIRTQAGATRRTQDEVFLRLYNALESRDMETASHVYRIGNASACIGGLLGWEDSRVDDIRWAAPLHDIGKIGISDAILSKPGPLTDEEFEIIKQHTVKGARILSGSKNRVIRMGEVLALSHHENWDGSGYPQGLKGEQIPLEARVVAVADVYDALLADRVYRKKMPKERALEIIGNDAGKKFDPAIVGVFMKHITTIHSHFRSPANGEEATGGGMDEKKQNQAARYVGAVAQPTDVSMQLSGKDCLHT